MTWVGPLAPKPGGGAAIGSGVTDVLFSRRLLWPYVALTLPVALAELGVAVDSRSSRR